MAIPNPDDDNRFRYVREHQLRDFDDRISDCRQMYESLGPDERLRFRVWLERVVALVREGEEWGANLAVRIEFDECDEDGEVSRWADTQFSPRTVLSAIVAWDAGQDFAPPGILP